MFNISIFLSLFAALLPAALAAGSWPQAAGPDFDFTDPSAIGAPTAWSVSLDQNVAWRTTLPETGQSSPIVCGERVFLTTMKPVEADASLGCDIVAWCFSAQDGSVIWQREIPGGYQTRLSGPFGDASSPSAVTDGKSVWFLNPTGRLSCFDLEGELRWTRAMTSVSRTQPVLHEGKLIFHEQVYLPDEHGHFGFENKDAPLEQWTQLVALDGETGSLIWRSRCGVNMGCTPLVQQLEDGTAVLAVGRGGGHGPPEKPEGVSLIRADNGTTLWTLELPNFMSTQTYPIVDDQALIFHEGDHLWVDATSGEITRQASIVTRIPVRRWTTTGRETILETLPEKKPRSITQNSNLRVGDYHYFRCYTCNYLGRVHLGTGAVEYLELPLQVLREPGQPDELLWNASQRPNDLAAIAEKKFRNNLSYTSLRHGVLRNARGFEVIGDDRAIGNGWGHTASPIATAFGNRLYVPILCGLVFVIQADAEVLDETAVLAINDLGPLGTAFTRASVTTDGTRVYGHTIRELIALGNEP